MPCRNTPVREDNVQICLVCRKPIADGEETKKLNRGGKRGVRHASCGQSVSSCPYVVYLTGPLEAVEMPPATRNEDLFPRDCERGRKRSTPCSPTTCGDESPRDPRLRRTTER